MSNKGLSREDTSLVLEKMRHLREHVANDQETIEKQKQCLRMKDSALQKIHRELVDTKKHLQTSSTLTETEFRSTARKYLNEVREEVDNLRQHRPARTLVKKPLRVVITGAAGQVGYALIPLFASGQVLGTDQPLILTLLEVESALKALQGVTMEIEDGAYPLVEAIVPTADRSVAFKDVDYAILVGGFPRGVGMERKDLLAKNSPIFQSMGEGLQKYAKETCKVLVVANPANTNCLICSRYAPKIPKCNFAALTRLDQNRATTQLAHKLGVKVRAVSNVILWGNHSATQVADVSNALVTIDGVQKRAEVEEKWASGELISTVQQRGKAVLENRGSSSAVSAANAIKDTIRDWHFGTPSGEHVALAVYSDGSHYGIAKDIFFSFPVTCRNGTYSIVQGLKIHEHIQSLIKKTEEELLQERHEAGLDK